MVQELEKRELEYELIIVPAEKEKVKVKIRKEEKKRKFRKHAKQHQELICVKNLKNKINGNISGFRNIIY
jgi:hypothetical protein